MNETVEDLSIFFPKNLKKYVTRSYLIKCNYNTFKMNNTPWQYFYCYCSLHDVRLL